MTLDELEALARQDVSRVLVPPADLLALIAQAREGAALAAALGTLVGHASVNVGMVADQYMATCGPHEAFGPTPAAALVALAGDVRP